MRFHFKSELSRPSLSCCQAPRVSKSCCTTLKVQTPEFRHKVPTTGVYKLSISFYIILYLWEIHGNTAYIVCHNLWQRMMPKTSVVQVEPELSTTIQWMVLMRNLSETMSLTSCCMMLHVSTTLNVPPGLPKYRKFCTIGISALLGRLKRLIKCI